MRPNNQYATVDNKDKERVLRERVTRMLAIQQVLRLVGWTEYLKPMLNDKKNLLVSQVLTGETGEKLLERRGAARLVDEILDQIQTFLREGESAARELDQMNSKGLL